MFDPPLVPCEWHVPFGAYALSTRPDPLWPALVLAEPRAAWFAALGAGPGFGRSESRIYSEVFIYIYIYTYGCGCQNQWDPIFG